MTQYTDDGMDPLKALRQELSSVAPPAEFEARVRQRLDVEGDTRGASWLSGWRWLVPAAAAAAVVFAVFVMSRPNTEAPQQVAAKATVETSNPIAVRPDAVVSSTAPTVIPGAVSSKFGVRSSSTSGRATGPEHPRTREPENPFPEVITNQAAVLRTLWARVDPKAPLVESVVKTTPDTVPEVVISPIEVSPIVIKWLGDPSTAPGTPVIRRITADTAERSAK